jgi:transcription elongation GreA/GreB family factor
MSKSELVKQVIAALKNDLDLAVQASSAAREAATDAQAKAEHKYDTRGLEQSYLADGQSRRASELIESIALLESMPIQSYRSHEPIGISAVVELESEEGEIQRFFLIPRKGGIKVKWKRLDCITLSIDSPLGERLLSKSLGDSIEVKVKAKTTIYTIVSLE